MSQTVLLLFKQCPESRRLKVAQVFSRLFIFIPVSYMPQCYFKPISCRLEQFIVALQLSNITSALEVFQELIRMAASVIPDDHEARVFLSIIPCLPLTLASCALRHNLVENIIEHTNHIDALLTVVRSADERFRARGQAACLFIKCYCYYLLGRISEASDCSSQAVAHILSGPFSSTERHAMLFLVQDLSRGFHPSPSHSA